jgi:hypothetical protein
MSPSPAADGVRLPAAAVANEAVRRYVRAHGDRPWTPEELAELAGLRRLWLEAERGLVRAA